MGKQLPWCYCIRVDHLRSTEIGPTRFFPLIGFVPAPAGNPPSRATKPVGPAILHTRRTVRKWDLGLFRISANRPVDLRPSRVTHRSKQPATMRHKIKDRLRNLQKQRSLWPHQIIRHDVGFCVTPGNQAPRTPVLRGETPSTNRPESSTFGGSRTFVRIG
jgi:hypothetical protein